MNHRVLSRLIAAAIMVAVVASAVNIDHVTKARAGRDAFLEYQSERYERYFAHPDFNQSVVESLLLCGAFLLVYEVIAFNTARILTFVSEAKPKSDDASMQ
jgi:ABC-type spermidine/putrescine transport system permease subunit I